MSDKWALVTGANGFVGSHLVRGLVERGEKVKAFVRPGADLRRLHGLPTDRVRIAVGELRVPSRVFAALRGCDRLYHLATQASLDERASKKLESSAVEGTEATLEAARRAGLEKIVVTSSISTLGSSVSEALLDESSEPSSAFAHAFARAKYKAEEVALARAQAGLPIVIVNPGLIVGAGDWEPTPVGACLVRYLKASPMFRVPFTPGGVNFVGVDDVVRGHLAAMDRGRVGERYILGGENLTHQQFVTKLSDLTGLAEPGEELSRGSARFAATREEWCARFQGRAPLFGRKLVDDYWGRFLFVSGEKAKSELGFAPRPLTESLVSALRWHIESGHVSEREARRVRLELRSVEA